MTKSNTAPAEPRQEGEQVCKCGLPKDDAIHSYTTEWQQMHKFDPKDAVMHPETPVVARAIANEVVGELFHIGEEEIGTKGRTREWVANLIAAIITRYFAATPLPETPASVEPRICLKCGHEERFSDNEGGICQATDDVEGEALRTMASSIFADYEPGSKAYSFGLRVVEYLRHENETNR